MSRFLSNEAAALAPYTPGEQPQDQQYIKLNTNESPFPPSPKVIKAISRAELLKLNLYSDPTCGALHAAIADYYGLKPENVLAGNGSDEVLAFAFRAFCGEGRGVAYADITYGFYKAPRDWRSIQQRQWSSPGSGVWGRAAAFDGNDREMPDPAQSLEFRRHTGRHAAGGWRQNRPARRWRCEPVPRW